jgi:hypothetical protein
MRLAVSESSDVISLRDWRDIESALVSTIGSSITRGDGAGVHGSATT